VIVRSGGEILGVQGVGVNAQEWINVMALAIERQINLNAIDSSAFVSPSFSEVISQVIQQWKGDRLPPRGNWRNWLGFR
jgi:pyruvate/2-oxoglutarate dehydrogenase complex dihydrolipoamide dehydrogenase (E3) component